jgi:MYXO-CTERM domain-containing protein
VTGAAVLLGSDVFQFSWRYQLPALVTLPPAGALGLTVIAGYVMARRRRPAGSQLPRQAAADPGDAGAVGLGGQPAADDASGRNEALGV